MSRSSFLERKQRLEAKLESEAASNAARIDAELSEIVPLNQPDNIPADVWALIQENGRLATERLNELLNSQRFHRLKASDQAKLIQLAQDRAYGRPDPGIKRTIKTVSHEIHDATAHSLRRLTPLLSLPEYRGRTLDTAAAERPLSVSGSDPSQTETRPPAAKTKGEQLE